MKAKWARWFAAAGVTVPEGFPLEIDPVYAVDAAELAKKGIRLG
jgi:hypothetical protein